MCGPVCSGFLKNVLKKNRVWTRTAMRSSGHMPSRHAGGCGHIHHKIGQDQWWGGSRTRFGREVVVAGARMTCLYTRT
jgi:hypothetical protein